MLRWAKADADGAADAADDGGTPLPEAVEVVDAGSDVAALKRGVRRRFGALAAAVPVGDGFPEMFVKNGNRHDPDN